MWIFPFISLFGAYYSYNHYIQTRAPHWMYLTYANAIMVIVNCFAFGVSQ